MSAAELASEALTIADVAAMSGLSAHTLRYDERIGLLDPVARAHGGQRRYRGDDLAWLAFLQRLRATGMPIRGMQRFAELRRQGDATIANQADGRGAIARLSLPLAAESRAPDDRQS